MSTRGRKQGPGDVLAREGGGSHRTRQERNAALEQPQIAAADPGLTGTEYAIYGVVFLVLPGINMLLSSALYYAWRGDKPVRAKQINRLGWMIFGLQFLLVFGVPIMLLMLT